MCFAHMQTNDIRIYINFLFLFVYYRPSGGTSRKKGTLTVLRMREYSCIYPL